MSEMLRYVIIDDEDREVNGYEWESFDEAKDEAIRLGNLPTTGSKAGYAIIQRTYVFEDSELVWTPDGELFWPPTPADLTDEQIRGHAPTPDEVAVWEQHKRATKVAMIRRICAKELGLSEDYPFFNGDYLDGESPDDALVRLFDAERVHQDSDERTVLILCHG